MSVLNTDLAPLDLTQIEWELSLVFEGCKLPVVDQASFDANIVSVKEANRILKWTDELFAPHITKAQEALDKLKDQKKKLTVEINKFVIDKRKEAADWKIADDAATKAATEAAAKSALDWTPLDGTPKPEVDLAVVKTEGAFLRKKPWEVVIEDEDKFWEADLRQFWLPNMKALKEEAKQKGTKFNIPGCKAKQEKGLTITG